MERRQSGVWVVAALGCAAFALAWRAESPVEVAATRPAGPDEYAVAYPESRPVLQVPAQRLAVRRAQGVRAACDLDVHTVCRDETCVGVLVAPDPDRGWGWARLAWSSPRFVASTILRDTGVPAGALPCGQAIAGLVGEVGVLAIDQPGAAEVWCATDGSDAGRALCSEASGVAFHDPRVRRFAR